MTEKDAYTIVEGEMVLEELLEAINTNQSIDHLIGEPTEKLQEMLNALQRYFKP